MIEKEKREQYREVRRLTDKLTAAMDDWIAGRKQVSAVMEQLCDLHSYIHRMTPMFMDEYPPCK